ncbi:MAG: class I SAM-dependent methyltransferase [Saprospiraceae bacterium]
MNCRFCNTELSHELVDLGFSPPSNSFLTGKMLNQPEVYYPLRIMVCANCFLVQIDEFAKHDDIFSSDYIYFSSYSKSWLVHCEDYVHMICAQLELNSNSTVIEIASNDGYLLQYFKQKGIGILGIEPTANTAQIAIDKGIPTLVEFFGLQCANRLESNSIKADLLIGNNVLAHVPDINDFVSGLKILLANNGVVTMEFPHLLQLIDKIQFDTIYHEHFSYLSLMVVKRIFEHHGLTIFNVEEIQTHGGSLRIYATHTDNASLSIHKSVENLIKKEINFGLNRIESNKNFQIAVNKVKNDFVSFLIEQKGLDKKVAAYGAAAKGNTLLNYCGVRKDLINFISDASPHKQNKFIPGMHIPVISEEKIKEEKPDFVVILPWNLKDEISEQLAYINSWGGQFVVAIPEIQIFSA